MKTTIHNLIILDESGSMSGIKHQTISGCNETLNTIRSAQRAYGETQDNYVSIFLFQSNDNVPSRYIIKNKPIDQVSDINGEMYQPWGCTPLYDAVGSTLADLKATVAGEEMAIGNVTIITDGMENSSQHYTLGQVARMIDALKEMGWTFNFIGANIDVRRAASSLHIDNHLEFQQTEEGTDKMFARERRSRMAWAKRTNDTMGFFACNDTAPMPQAAREEMIDRLKESAKDYFAEDNDEA